MLSNVVAEIDAEIARLTQARSLLSRGAGMDGDGSGVPSVKRRQSSGTKQRTQMSPEGRARVAAAMRKRWADKRKK
jgi:hypothetical protein